MAQVLPPSVEVIAGIHSNQASGTGAFAVSKNGTLAYASGGQHPGTELVVIDRNGKDDLLTDERRAYHELELSPNGTKLALS